MKQAGQGHGTASLGLSKHAHCEAARGQRQAQWQQTGSLVYCDCCAEVAGLFLIKTQRLSVGLLQGLSDALPVNAANLIQFSFSMQVIQALYPFLPAFHLHWL